MVSVYLLYCVMCVFVLIICGVILIFITEQVIEKEYDGAVGIIMFTIFAISIFSFLLGVNYGRAVETPGGFLHYDKNKESVEKIE